MLYNDNLPVRYPKSKFAMWTAYSFTTASVLMSIVFSLLLFLSIDDDPVMKTLFGGLAIIFELGKFFAWYEVGERKSRRNYSGAFSALIFYGVLAAISIGGSVGGINSATNKAQSHVNIQQSQINAFNRQITAIDQQIALNNQGAQKYIELELISTGLKRIQKANDSLRQEQQTLAQERDNLPVVTQGSVLGLIDSLARSFNIDSQTAQLGLVVFLSVLLDFFAAFFIGLIGEEQRFCQRFRHTKTVTIETDEEPAPPKLLTHHLDDENNTVEPITKSLYEQAIEAFENKHINCSKRALIPFLNIDSEQAHVIFEQFMDEGLVSKKPNNHYRWHGKTIEV